MPARLGRADDDGRPSSTPPAPTTTTTGSGTTPAAPPPAPLFSDSAEHAIATKALFPYLSPEDQKQQGMLYGITPVNTTVPTQITGQVRNQYLSSDRAQQALNSLNATTGLNQGGPGYKFLTNAINLLKQFGGDTENGMSRENYLQFNKQFTNLLASVKGDKFVEPFVPIAQAFLNPNFTAGELMPQTKVAGGSPYLGAPNPRLYT